MPTRSLGVLASLGRFPERELNFDKLPYKQVGGRRDVHSNVCVG